MKFKLVEHYTSFDLDEAYQFIQEYIYEAIDDLKSAPLEEYQKWFRDTSDYVYECNFDALDAAVRDTYIEAIDCGKINRPKTMVTSELQEYLESNSNLLKTDVDALMKNCPDHLKHELTLVLDKINYSLNEETLRESINTNLRKFLISLLELSTIDWKTRLEVSNIDEIVVHHKNKERKENSMENLVLVSDHNHRSMHRKYSKDKWQPDVLKDYAHIPVTDLLKDISKSLINVSKQFEDQVD